MSNMFANALEKEANYTTTENGAIALKSTTDACLDLFGTIGSLRTREEDDIIRLFSMAYAENSLTATKMAFYSRDIRNGCGERRTFRTIIKWLANEHPAAVRPNIKYFGEFGRFDDLYELIGTKCETQMWEFMKTQFNADVAAMNANKHVSLLAKWIKTPDASSESTRKLGIATALNLGYKVPEFKRLLRKLRKYIDVTEVKMSTKQWAKINYSSVPSKAAMNYSRAFSRHDLIRYTDYLDAVKHGKEKINASTLFPYDIIEKIIYGCGKCYMDVLESQWKALPDFVEKGSNSIVIADVSGSMSGRPMATSIGLALYFAEHNIGAFHNLCMVFSSDAKVIKIRGERLVDKIHDIEDSDIWYGSTNLAAAFYKILDIAVTNRIHPSEMVKSVIVISDMEIDEGCSNMTFHEYMSKLYNEAGYELPKVIYWNADSRHDVFHADKNTPNCQLISGQSTTAFKHLIDAIDMSAVELMMNVLYSARYECITVDFED